MSKVLFDGGSPFIKNPEVILDLGARDFNESILFASLYPNAKVYSFECNAKTIEKNIWKLLNKHNIKLIPKAVREYTGKTTFYPVSSNPPKGYSPNVGASSLFKASGHMTTEPIFQTEEVVECTTLADWASQEGISKVDVIWMDIQGAEYLALKGLGDLIDTVKVIFTEVTYKELYQGQDMFPELHQFLTSKGFTKVYHDHAVTCPEWFGEAVYARV